MLSSQSDIFVQHSVVPPDGAMEGSPVAIAEASAAGLPVVVTRGCGGTEDLVIHGRTGFLVEQRDTDDMAACMVRPAARRGPPSTTGEGRTHPHMCKEFDAERQIAKLEDVPPSGGDASGEVTGKTVMGIASVSGSTGTEMRSTFVLPGRGRSGG